MFNGYRRKKVDTFVRCFLIGYLILTLTGCFHISKPTVPNSLSQSSDSKYSAQNFRDDYKAYKQQVTSGDTTGATATRDQMINRVEVDIEQDYREFEGNLFQTRAGLDTAGDVVELGISAATGVVSGTDVKDLLSASLTVQGNQAFSRKELFSRENHGSADIANASVPGHSEESNNAKDDAA